MRPISLPTLCAIAALGVASLPGTAAAQDARACSNEVQRLSDGFPGATGASQAPGVSGQQPGARVDAGMDDKQQQQIRDIIQQARTAGEQGDGAGCMQRLNQARGMLRQSGVGAAQSGDATIPGGQGTADRSPNLQGEQAPPGSRGAASDTRSGTSGGTASGTTGGASGTTPQGAEAPSTPTSPPTAGTPRRNTRDSAVSPGGTGNSTSRGTTSGGSGGGGSGGGGSGGGGSGGGGSGGGGGGR